MIGILSSFLALVFVGFQTQLSFLQVVGQDLVGNEGCPGEKRVAFFLINFQGMQVFCYVALWYQETYSHRFSEDDLDPFLCTHIILPYFTFTQNGSDFVFAKYERGEALARALIDRTRDKRSTQFLLSVGGYADHAYQKYTMIGKNARVRTNFINRVLDLLKLHHAHGVDFKWNFIGRRDYADTGDKTKDLQDLAEITKDLCGRLKKEGFLCVITLVKVEKRTLISNEKYLANIASIIRAADFVNIWTADIIPATVDSGFALMPQDLLIPTEQKNGSSSYYKGYEDKSINFVVEFYNAAVQNDTELMNKLSMVIALQFGTHGFPRGDNVSINTRTAMHDDKNPITGEKRYQYPFFEICKNFMEDTTSQWKMIEFPGGVPVAIDHGWDPAVPNNAAIPTLNEAYVKKKVAFARRQNLGGISIFHITADDIYGWCYNQTYPILNAINDEINGCRFL